jgi:hypothetical protein
LIFQFKQNFQAAEKLETHLKVSQARKPARCFSIASGSEPFPCTQTGKKLQLKKVCT